MLTDSLRFHSDVGTSNPQFARNVSPLLNELKDELARFRWPDQDPDNPRYHQG
jgi:hypothetical protein